jgi:hypothetical protein
MRIKKLVDALVVNPKPSLDRKSRSRAHFQ